MAESLTIARPYAEAVFKLAQERNELPSWSDALSRLAVVAGTDVARDLIGNPRLAAKQLAGVLDDAAGQLTPEQKNFVQVLADNERLDVLPDIASLFETQRNQYEGVLDAQIGSAYPLTPPQVDEIVAALAAKYGRQIKATVHVEPELIGGVSIRVGDEVIDASVRGKLAQMAGALKI
jgi:F-type H+-transporting ATPase subunit delta